jgi:hypothetical protein
MAVLLGTFTDKGREWFAKVMAGIQLQPDSLVFLRNTINGVAGNVAITETVLNASFVVTGMSNGTAGTPAIGTIRTIAGSLINDGEIFTLADGVNPVRTFEFDKNGSVTPGRAPVTITNLMTPEQVAVAIVEAVTDSANVLQINAGFTTRTAGFVFFRMGEGGFQVLPTLEKVPVAASTRKNMNGIQAGHGVKGDLTIAPDAAPLLDQITVSSLNVPDVNTNFFFVEKNLRSADIALTVLSGVEHLAVVCTLGLIEANVRYIAQGGGSPNFYEIGIYAREGTTLFEIGYVTFPLQVKVNTLTLTNTVVFEV